MAHYPLVELLKKAKENSGSQSIAYKRLLPWLVKYVITSPFHFLDQRKVESQLGNLQLSQDPVFILGHWRSGTSFLQYLLSADPDFEYLNKFESVFPELFLTGEKLFKPAVENISDLMKVITEVRKVSVDWEDWSSAGELDIAQLTYISKANPHWGHLFPANADYYLQRYLYLDEAPPEAVSEWKESYSYLIKKLALKKENKPLLIKSPGNTARVKHLLDLYPNARFIYLHRYPLDVFYSNMKLWSMVIEKFAFQQIGRREIEEMVIQNYKKILAKYLEQRQLIPKENLIELPFKQFVDNPLDTLANIYSEFDWKNFEDVRPIIRKQMPEPKKSGTNGYHYNPEHIKRLENEWSFVFEEWNYPYLSKGVTSDPDGEIEAETEYT